MNPVTLASHTLFTVLALNFIGGYAAGLMTWWSFRWLVVRAERERARRAFHEADTLDGTVSLDELVERCKNTTIN